MAKSAVNPVAIKIDSDMKARVKRLAEAQNRTSHWLMREAVGQYVERGEKRSSFRRDAIKAWDEYQATGMHVSETQADAWLAKLEVGEDAEPPECHA